MKQLVLNFTDEAFKKLSDSSTINSDSSARDFMDMLIFNLAENAKEKEFVIDVAELEDARFKFIKIICPNLFAFAMDAAIKKRQKIEQDASDMEHQVGMFTSYFPK